MLAAVGIHFCFNWSFNEEQLRSLVQYSLPEPQTLKQLIFVAAPSLSGG